MAYNQYVKEVARSQAQRISRISEFGYKDIHRFQIDCKNLDDYNSVDIRYSEAHKEMFEKLMNIKNPVLYVFEIMSDTTSQAIVNSMTNYSNSENSKRIPSIKKAFPDTRILYVGKSVRNFWGRIIHHLGFYRIGGTQGLQLFYWAKALELELQLTVLEFEKGSNELMPLFEKGLAMKLRPIIGRHK